MQHRPQRHPPPLSEDSEMTREQLAREMVEDILAQILAFFHCICILPILLHIMEKK